MFPSEHFFSYLLGFVAGSEKPFKPRGSRRSEWQILAGVAVLFHGDKHAHTHTQLHTQGGQRQTGRSCCYPFSCPRLGPGRLLKKTWCLQPKWPCLVPSQEEEPELQRPGDEEKLLPSAGTPLSMPAGKQQSVLWLLPDTSLASRTGKGHGRTDWSWLTELFHSTAGTQQSGWTDTRTMALALSCRKEFRSLWS